MSELVKFLVGNVAELSESAISLVELSTSSQHLRQRLSAGSQSSRDIVGGRHVALLVKREQFQEDPAAREFRDDSERYLSMSNY